jgi:O-antigen/teichoic acid export membrane protein
MTDHNFLYKVLGLSALPRVFTFGLTLLSFPLMVRGLGAAEYGVMVFLASVTGLLELVAGLGVSAAVGKALAECRVSRPDCLESELRNWASLQLWACLFSALPSVLAGYLLVSLGSQERPLDLGLFVLVVLTMYVSVFVAFARAAMSSMLAYKELAVLDTLESVVRSAGWLVVGLWLHSVWALAWAGLLTSTMALCMASFVVLRLLARQPAKVESLELPSPDRKAMLRQSAGFMALSLGTRTYQSLPVLLVGRLLGYEVTGIWGAFTKVVEILSLPFTIIGNALMVRAPEIKRKGYEALCRYWNMLSKLAALAVVVFLGFVLMSVEAAGWMLPRSELAVPMFVVMSVLVLARSVSDLFAPAADYVGGLRRRIVFLCSFSAVQLPVIWLGATLWGAVGATAVMVASYALMVAGYIVIARGVFFEGRSYRFARVALLAGAFALLCAVLAWVSVSEWRFIRRCFCWVLFLFRCCAESFGQRG